MIFRFFLHLFGMLRLSQLTNTLLARIFCLYCLISVGLFVSLSRSEEKNTKTTIIKSRENELVRFENYQGAITLEGWNQDRIKITAIAKDKQGTPLPHWPEFLSIEDEPYLDGIRVRLLHSRGKEISEKLKLQNFGLPQVDLFIQAPAHRPAEVRTGSGALSVKGWREDLSVSSFSGNIELNDLDGGKVLEVVGPQGNIDLSNSRFNRISISGGLNKISVKKAFGATGHFDSSRGGIILENSKIVDLDLISESGEIFVNDFEGDLRFSGGSGNVTLSKMNGAVSGITKQGKIELKANRWRPSDLSFFESLTGDIYLDLPNDYRGQLDLETRSFNLEVNFPAKMLPVPSFYGPPPPGRWYGVVREMGQVLRVRSRLGSIRVF